MSKVEENVYKERHSILDELNSTETNNTVNDTELPNIDIMDRHKYGFGNIEDK